MKKNYDQTLIDLLNLNKDSKRVFVFDIDSTLFNVTPRNQEIIRHFARTQPMNEQLKSELEEFILNNNDWGIKPGLIRLNSSHLTDSIIKSIKSHWNTFFFSNEFLHHDKTYPGSVEFINKLNQISPVYYLTGRDTDRMGKGTIIQLQNSGFPLTEENNKLILKPNKDLLDHNYKLDELKKLKNEFKEIHFFENEPVILNTIYDNLPQINLYYVDSVNSGRAEIYPHILKIKPHYPNS